MSADSSNKRNETGLASFAVVVPMFNEAVGAEAFVQVAAPALNHIPNRNCLVLVDDGSTDGTGTILEKLNERFSDIVVLKHGRNAGYGAGLVTGAKFASDQGFDFVLFMDSDLTNPPDHIERFVGSMSEGADLIKGCRYCPGGGVEGVPMKAYLISRVGNLIARILLGGGVRDGTNGFRAIRTDKFLEMPLQERGFALIMEELMWARRRSLSIVNVPTTLYGRSADQRQTMFTYSFELMARYLKYALAARFASKR